MTCIDSREQSWTAPKGFPKQQGLKPVNCCGLKRPRIFIGYDFNEGPVPKASKGKHDVDSRGYSARLCRTFFQISPTTSSRRGVHLRGFFGREFANEVLLHHHEVDGSFRYAYPKVQFKVLDQTAYLIGLAEGAELVTRLWSDVDQCKSARKFFRFSKRGFCGGVND